MSTTIRNTNAYGTYVNLSDIIPHPLPGPLYPTKSTINYGATTTAQTLNAQKISEAGLEGSLGFLSYLSTTNVILLNASGGANLNTDTATNYLNYFVAQGAGNNFQSNGDLLSFTISNVSGQSITPVAGTNVTLAGTVNSALANNTSHLVTMLVTATGTPAITMRGTQLV